MVRRTNRRTNRRTKRRSMKHQTMKHRTKRRTKHRTKRRTKRRTKHRTKQWGGGTQAKILQDDSLGNLLRSGSRMRWSIPNELEKYNKIYHQGTKLEIFKDKGSSVPALDPVSKNTAQYINYLSLVTETSNKLNELQASLNNYLYRLKKTERQPTRWSRIYPSDGVNKDFAGFELDPTIRAYQDELTGCICQEGIIYDEREGVWSKKTGVPEKFFKQWREEYQAVNQAQPNVPVSMGTTGHPHLSYGMNDHP